MKTEPTTHTSLIALNGSNIVSNGSFRKQNYHDDFSNIVKTEADVIDDKRVFRSYS
jgi:hypothetical protein